MSKDILAQELSRQKLFTEDLRQILEVRKKGEIPLALVRTYGCQQNVADGEKIKGMLGEMGFAFTEDADLADFIIFNTCAVREHAEDRVFGNIGALKNNKRRNPGLIIAVCGCMMEQEQVAEKIRKSFPFVNIVFGTHVIHKLPQMLYTAIVDSKRIFVRGEEQAEIAEGLPIRRDGGSRAFVTVMYGCDNFCSYCIVPYVRGREKSRSPKHVEEEFRSLVAEGYKDITLLGQNVNSYGKGLSEDINFAELLRRLDRVEGDFRIRFMTSHPKDASVELFKVMAESKHICHHIHLPFQSGNNRVLKEMNRRYTREQYLKLIETARELMPDISFTSDVIVGFPSESYQEFLDTLSLIQEVEFNSLFTFIYSKRQGTKAAEMEDMVEDKEKSRWFSQLLKLQEEIAAKRCKAMEGQSLRVLVEEKNAKNGLLAGRTEGSIIVEFPGEDTLIGSFCNVRITEAKNWILKGILE